MKKQSNAVKFVYFGAIAALLTVFGAFVLEKSQVTNFYSKPTPVTIPTLGARPVNSIEYTPADPTDNEELNQKKNDGTLDNVNNPPQGAPINIVVTAAGQDSQGGPVVIKLLLTDVTSGVCDIKLTKNEISKSYSAPVINAGNYYACDGFEIPLADLSVGMWDMTATVTSANNRLGKINQTLEVK